MNSTTNSLLCLGPEDSPPFSVNSLWKFGDLPSLDSTQQSDYPPPSRHRRNSKTQTKRENISPERAKHLERNRIAANKCREKKKHERAQLQATLDAASAKHKVLETEVDILQEEIWHLKNQLFIHARCEDQQIDLQLCGMANKLKSVAEDPLEYPSTPQSMGTSPVQPIMGPSIALGTEDGTNWEINGDGLFDTFVDLPCCV
ncbi:hypothetical protein N7456_009881 [Penicillium angulare]|uniref:BZIP domain-containing protein n=1 Tax=Penicillium angulare TaxID=116970 RepID=A0A9W9K5Y7_9EURO|nr:hypothetical protein N7456_009881 [Penicillium angulare]